MKNYKFYTNSDIDMSKIKDSMQIDSETEICCLEKDKHVVTIEVRGDVRVFYNDAPNPDADMRGPYKYYDEFPENLKSLIENDDKWTFNPRVNICENNWFEIFIWERDGNGNLDFITSDVIDIEGETNKELEDDCIEFLEEYLKNIA